MKTRFVWRMCIPGTSLSRYINLYTDFAFKKIFGTEANKDLLISFLNAALKLEGNDVIKKASYMQIDSPGAIKADRDVVFDLYCETGKGENIIVELQKARPYNFSDRVLYFSSLAIQESIKKSHEWPWKYKYAPVYTLSILDFNHFKSDSGNYIFHTEFTDQYGQVFSDSIRYTFIELPKFKKTEKDLNTLLEKWLYVIKNLYKLKDKPAALTEGIFRKLFEVAEIASYKQEDRTNYEESLKNLWDLNNCLDAAERKGHVEGKEEGLAEGRAEGRAEGEAIGANKEKIENARKMKSKGYPIEDIAEITGHSVKEIDKL